MTTRTPDESMPADAGPRGDRATRRTFTAEYKRAIVAEYDAAPVGYKGAVLRRERLYDSHVQEWRAYRGGHVGCVSSRAAPRHPGPYERADRGHAVT